MGRWKWLRTRGEDECAVGIKGRRGCVIDATRWGEEKGEVGLQCGVGCSGCNGE